MRTFCIDVGNGEGVTLSAGMVPIRVGVSLLVAVILGIIASVCEDVGVCVAVCIGSTVLEEVMVGVSV